MSEIIWSTCLSNFPTYLNLRYSSYKCCPRNIYLMNNVKFRVFRNMRFKEKMIYNMVKSEEMTRHPEREVLYTVGKVKLKVGLRRVG